MNQNANIPVILGGARTPFGRFRGGLTPFSSSELGAHAIRAALERTGVAPEQIGAVIVGQVIQAGAGQGPARQASLAAGIGWDVPTTTINKLCLSGLTAVIDAARMIRTGEADFIVAAGQESMTNAPHLVPGLRAGVVIGDAPMLDSLNHDGLQDPVSGKLMGEATDSGNAERGISREEQDAVAARSHQRAAAARAAGVLAEEIAPIQVPQRKGPAITLDHDEGIRPDTTAESLAQLRPAFSKAETATITAGSASPLSDGAAALVTRRRPKLPGWNGFARSAPMDRPPALTGRCTPSPPGPSSAPSRTRESPCRSWTWWKSTRPSPPSSSSPPTILASKPNP